MKPANQIKAFLASVKNYDLALFASLLLLGTGLIAGKDTVDLHISDTYIIFESGGLMVILGSYLTLLSLLYFLTNKLLYAPVLSRAHIIINIICCFAIPTIFFLTNTDSLPNQRNNYSSFQLVNGIQVTLIRIMLLSHILFVVNFLMGLFTLRRLRS